MGHHIALPPGPNPAPDHRAETGALDGDDGVLAELEGNLQEVVQRLRVVIAGGEPSPQLIREFSGANRVLIGLIAERRQQRKARQSALDRISVALMLDRLRGMTPEEREHVRRELGAMDTKQSVLG